MRKLFGLTLLSAGLILPVTAQAQNWGGDPPQCDLNTGHFLVNSANLYVKAAAEADFEDGRDGNLRNANRALNQALNRGQADNGSVWYLFGRMYEMQEDLAGADSTYARAARLEPGCAEDIENRRRRMWVPIINAGIEALQNGDMETARERFEAANQIFQGEPQAYFYLGDIYARELGQPDSAISLFKVARQKAMEKEDPEESVQSMIVNSSFMIAQLYHINDNLDSAAVWYEAYLERSPDDADAVSRLAQVYTALGDQASANALYGNILEGAEDFRAEDLFSVGVNMFLAENYATAEEAFTLGLEKNPHFRDGLYNLANTYIAMAQVEGADEAAIAAKLQPIADRLVAIDPYNQQSLRIQAESRRLAGMQNETLEILENANAKDFDVNVTDFRNMGDGSWSMTGVILNLREQAVSIPAITFEFVDASGNVITTETTEPAEAEVGGGTEINLRPVGEGIAAWRYTVGS